jgi:ribonuclease P protein component
MIKMGDALQKNTFPKSERLCSRKEIDRLFADGASISVSPIKLIFIDRKELPQSRCLTMFVVPKRNFRRAHDRNKLKRRMREAFRLGRHGFYETLSAKEKCVSMAMLYTGRRSEEYGVISRAVETLLARLAEKCG